MVLALRPSWSMPRASRRRAARTRHRPAGAYRWQSFAERTASGALGDPTAASAAKGERLLEAAGRGASPSCS